MMIISQREKHRKKLVIHDITRTPNVTKPIPKQPIVLSIKPEQEEQLVKDLLGNFSDQTGASFG